ncbi:MAG TPA: hypothetical protein DEQ73_00835 [Phycisphaerales bacterium]|nr:hypothetical protein [Phycisphaerales bacterium]
MSSTTSIGHLDFLESERDCGMMVLGGTGVTVLVVYECLGPMLVVGLTVMSTSCPGWMEKSGASDADPHK